MKTFKHTFKMLIKIGIKIYIITCDPKEHTNGYKVQSEQAIQWCEYAGIQVLLCGNLHRKLAHAVGLKVGICEQGPSDFPDLCEFLVKEGIDSISLSPDTVLKTAIRINEVEKNLSR
jgi:hypothetical protein